MSPRRSRPPRPSRARRRAGRGAAPSSLLDGCGEPGDIAYGDVVVVDDGAELVVGMYDDDEEDEDDGIEFAIVYPGKYRDDYLLVPREACRRVSAAAAHAWWRRHWGPDFYGAPSNNAAGVAMMMGHRVPEDLIAAGDLRDPALVQREIASFLEPPLDPTPPRAPPLKLIKGGR